MKRRTTRVLAVLAAATLVTAGCGDDDDADVAPTEAPPVATEPSATAATGSTAETVGTDEGIEDGERVGDRWTVDTEDCIDPDRVNEPIEGTVTVASAGPLSGGPAAAAFAPVIQGFQAYIDYANENGLLPGHEIVLEIGDDQYNPGLTPNEIDSGLDAGAHLVAGLIGTPNNLAVRDTLNEECVPQLLSGSGAPELGDVENYPWTTGILLPYDIETKAYAEDVAREFPDGATAAVFYANNDFGVIYRDTIAEVAGEYGIEIVDEQTIEAPDTTPPVAQLASIAANTPDVIIAAPSGVQCATFMSELANAKAAAGGWDPRVYVTNTCSSPLILGIAGAAADGIYTSAPYANYDVPNPTNAEIPGIVTYTEAIEAAGLADTIPTSSAGWTIGEVLIEILRRAAESPEGLTQASIINTARNFDYQPSLTRDGAPYATSGEEDAYFVEDVQITQYDAEGAYFNDVGELITSFRAAG